jgi:hypothetical protein
MKKIGNLVPPDLAEQIEAQQQLIINFLSTVPTLQPIGVTALNKLARKLSLESENLRALIFIYGGEVQQHGK